MQNACFLVQLLFLTLLSALSIVKLVKDNPSVLSKCAHERYRKASRIANRKLAGD